MRNHPGPQLMIEYNVYKTLRNVEGVPRVYCFGPCSKWNALIMEMMGKSLENLFDICGRKFTLKTTIQILLQVLNIIEYVHSKRFIYRDIKPENCMIGRIGKSNLLINFTF